MIASKAASPSHPDWYHNLVAHPEAIIEIGTEKFPVRATIAEGEERERLFNAQAALMPFFAEYQQQTTRQIPVIILTGDISTDTLRRVALEQCVQLHKPVKGRELLRVIQRLLAMPPDVTMPAVSEEAGKPIVFVVEDDSH